MREANSFVFVWHHVDGVAPDWEVREVEELRSGAWGAVRISHRWILRSHPQEVLENAVDTAHFAVVHGDQAVGAKSLSLEMDGPRLRHRIAQEIKSPLHKWLRRPAPVGTIDATVQGLGIVVFRVLTGVSFPAELFSIFGVRPIDDGHVELIAMTSVAKHGSRLLDELLTRLVLRNIKYTVEQDVPLFEQKTYVDMPPLCEGDGPIMRFRRWAKQFYGEARAAEAGASSAGISQTLTD